MPGFTSGRDRRALLSLATITAAIPDETVGRGWLPILEHLASLDDSRDPLPQFVSLMTVAEQQIPPERRPVFTALTHELHDIQQNPKFSTFLALLGLDDQAEGPYRDLPEVFTPPVSYSEIVRVLQDEHVVFILGDPHMGKTFTALNLLWEAYRDKRRHVDWLRADFLEKTLRRSETSGRQLLERLNEGSTVYLEDPFGRTTPMDVGRFAQSLRNLVIGVKNRNVQLIITSRTVIFDKVVTADFSRYVITLTKELLLGAAYPPKLLAHMCMAYFEAYDVLWARDDPTRLAAQVTEELTAPHNVEEFLRATRLESSPTKALEQVQFFRDIVEEYANHIGSLSTSQCGALAVIAYFGDLETDSATLGSLYEGGWLAGASGVRWEVAKRGLNRYLVERTEGWAFRHPSMVEGLERSIRRTSELLDRMWSLVDFSTRQPGLSEELGGLQILSSFADIFAEDDRGIQAIRTFFDSPHLGMREQSRYLVIARFDRVAPEAAEQLLRLALDSWSDRMILRLLLRRPSIDQEADARVVVHLSRSRDTQTRYLTAVALSTVLVADEGILAALLCDAAASVRRAAFTSLVRRLRDQTTDPTNPISTGGAIRQSLEGWGEPDRHWARLRLSDEVLNDGRVRDDLLALLPCDSADR
jgi:hypothetical protein